MSDLPTCEAIHSAISSPALESGRPHFDSLAGLTTDLFGPVPVRANLSARQAKDLGLMTSGISGQLGTGSSSSAALQSSLASRLRARMSSHGSTLYQLTWKPWVLPSGRSLSRLRASAPQCRETGLSGWQTPRARGDAGGQRWRNGRARNLEDQARIYGLLRGLTVSEAAAMSLSATFCRRLMGLPAEWDDCAPTETASTLKRLRNLSAQPPKPLTQSDL